MPNVFLPANIKHRFPPIYYSLIILHSLHKKWITSKEKKIDGRDFLYVRIYSDNQAGKQQTLFRFIYSLICVQYSFYLYFWFCFIWSNLILNLIVSLIFFQRENISVYSNLAGQCPPIKIFCPLLRCNSSTTEHGPCGHNGRHHPCCKDDSDCKIYQKCCLMPCQCYKMYHCMNATITTTTAH